MNVSRATCSKCHKNEKAVNKQYCLSCHSAYMREWRKTHPLTPEQKFKDNARSYANVYQRFGRITKQPCEECGNPKAEKHRDDYSKPLKVRWLCRIHHMAFHKKESEKKEQALCL